MAIFLTGSTGYIGAHIAAILRDRHTDRLNLLVRAKTEQEAKERLWQALQLHVHFPQFRDALETRISVFRGDLTDPRFGLDHAEYARLVGTTESVIHCAASLNRKSEKSCLNVNLRGTLEVAQLARRAQKKILRAYGARTASRGAAHGLPPEHRAGRQPPRRDHTIRHGPRVRLPCRPACPAVPPGRPDRHRPSGLRGGISRRAAPEAGSAARDLPPVFGPRRRNFWPSYSRDCASSGRNGSLVLARARTSVLFRCELAGGLSRRNRPQRFAAEGIHAVPCVGHCVRQFARRGGDGPRPGTVLEILLSTAAFQPRLPFLVSVPGMDCFCCAAARGPCGGWRGALWRIPTMMDFILQAWTSSLVEMSSALWKLGAGRSWQPGEKLNLLFAGYNGTRNTGSDVRVEEMLRQVRRVLGKENLALSVMSQNLDWSRGYFGDARQVFLPDIYPPFLFREVRRHHGVIACEGSMFKSKFADALTTMFIGALGIASVENKLSVGYGAEAGYMDPLLEKMCARYCRRSLIITRNQESQAV